MIPSVKTRAHRKLKRLVQFKFCDKMDCLPQLAGCDTPLDRTEELIGAYENASGAKQGLMLVTDRCLHWWTKGKWQSLKYSDMLAVEWPSRVKMEARDLPIATRSGKLVRVPIQGGTECTRDVFSVMTFIMRMIEDESRRNLQKSPKTNA